MITSTQNNNSQYMYASRCFLSSQLHARLLGVKLQIRTASNGYTDIF